MIKKSITVTDALKVKLKPHSTHWLFSQRFQAIRIQLNWACSFINTSVCVISLHLTNCIIDHEAVIELCTDFFVDLTDYDVDIELLPLELLYGQFTLLYVQNWSLHLFYIKIIFNFIRESCMAIYLLNVLLSLYLLYVCYSCHVLVCYIQTSKPCYNIQHKHCKYHCIT